MKMCSVKNTCRAIQVKQKVSCKWLTKLCMDIQGAGLFFMDLVRRVPLVTVILLLERHRNQKSFLNKCKNKPCNIDLSPSVIVYY